MRLACPLGFLAKECRLVDEFSLKCLSNMPKYQMLGMNAEVIHRTFTGLVQLLAQTTHSLNVLAGCPSDQTIGPAAGLKVSLSWSFVNVQ